MDQICARERAEALDAVVEERGRRLAQGGDALETVRGAEETALDHRRRLFPVVRNHEHEKEAPGSLRHKRNGVSAGGDVVDGFALPQVRAEARVEVCGDDPVFSAGDEAVAAE